MALLLAEKVELVNLLDLVPQEIIVQNIGINQQYVSFLSRQKDERGMFTQNRLVSNFIKCYFIERRH